MKKEIDLFRLGVSIIALIAFLCLVPGFDISIYVHIVLGLVALILMFIGSFKKPDDKK